MKPMNNLDKAKRIQQEVEAYSLTFSINNLGVARGVAGVAANLIPCTPYCSKAGELNIFVYVEDLQKILNDTVYPKQKTHTKSYFNQQ